MIRPNECAFHHDGRPDAGLVSTRRALVAAKAKFILEVIARVHKKTPEAWIRLSGFGLAVVKTEPARPYSLPLASVSKESDSRER